MTAGAEMLMAVVILLVAMLLGCAAVLILALGARSWSEAVAAQHRARAHGIQADEAEATLSATKEAVEEVKRAARAPYVPPTDDELTAALIAQRQGMNGKAHEYTTESNEGIDEQEPIPGGGYYRVGEGG